MKRLQPSGPEMEQPKPDRQTRRDQCRTNFTALMDSGIADLLNTLYQQ